MTRSERLAKKNKVEVVLYNVPIICNAVKNIPEKASYVATDFCALYNKIEHEVDIYEDVDGNFYGVLL